MTAELVTSVQVKPEKGGELRFTALDASPVCTADRVAAQECNAVWHVAIKNVTTNTDADVYTETRRDETGLVTTFELPTGEYRIVGINVNDIWGNATHALPPSVQAVFSVK